MLDITSKLHTITMLVIVDVKGKGNPITGPGGPIG
jgi:hypothetical protein